MNEPAAIELVSTAAAIARRAHAGQFRRDGKTPYIQHPEAVARRLAGDTKSEAVAWLHDVLEDTEISPEELLAHGLPLDVVSAVVALTREKSVPYEDYLRGVKENAIAKKVKIADIVSNLADSPTDQQIAKYAKALLYLLS